MANSLKRGLFFQIIDCLDFAILKVYQLEGRKAAGIFTWSWTPIVAAYAGCWGAFEYTVDMTQFTIDFYMLATERKTSGEMVKVGVFNRIGA